MTSEMKCPDTKLILAGLKDFQRATVDHVFNRMYLDNPVSRRFLIADEVGLGKTLVARGIVAKAVEHLWPRGNRIDIVYVCSNSDIARQNINRLNIAGRRDFILPPRLTLLAALPKSPSTEQRSIFHPRFNLISFTPGTALDMRSQTGIAEERALLVSLLKQVWSLRGMGVYNVLQGYVENAQWFRNRVARFQENYVLDSGIVAEFAAQVPPALKDEFLELCDAFPREREVQPAERPKLNSVIGRLRETLARSSLKTLEPDLVILDEFQKFKHLLDDDTDDAALAKELFSYSDEHDAVRVLLLSATPYKMYRMNHEADTEDHYQDFSRTLQFLSAGRDADLHIRETLQQFRSALFTLDPNNLEPLLQFKASLEGELRKVMVRTERLASTPDRSGMLREVRPDNVQLQPYDLNAYLGFSRLAEALDHGDVLEYWKSAAYPLNFMEDYDVKQRLKNAIDENNRNRNVRSALKSADGLLLPWGKIVKYQEVPPPNAKLRSVISAMTAAQSWQLLWVPPAMPYYAPEGVFATPEAKAMTKQLIFSSWKMVPKIVACMSSYEAERRMILPFEQNARNTPHARAARKPLLKFARSAGRLTGMPLLSLIYPCRSLANAFDPLRWFAAEPGSIRTVADLIGYHASTAIKMVQSLCKSNPTEGREDERWYWLAPLLLDATNSPAAFASWIDSELQAEADEDEEDHTLWKDHLREASEKVEEFRNGRLQLGRMPSDFGEVLVTIALASPALAASRSCSRLMGSHDGGISMVVDGSVGRAFLTQFNLPEIMALLRSQNDKEPYWKLVLRYCAAGNLQSVLDEYVHVLAESLGLMQPTTADLKVLSDAMSDVLRLRTSSLSVDNIYVSSGPVETVHVKQQSMRSRFALRFDNAVAEDGARQVRRDHVRAAFNSPFWPFILATTSVGQEGLDFHWYCHSVTHWNLPANPVDLEQREGRVHRYKGHAIRKNLVNEWGQNSEAVAAFNVWASLFEMARSKRKADETDLFPFWVYPLENGARIERRVLDLPLSRDAEKLINLRKSLAVYRLVFGQSRQEDLVEFLSQTIPPSRMIEICQQLKLDLSPCNACSYG